jgi:hypothetical protein
MLDSIELMLRLESLHAGQYRVNMEGRVGCMLRGYLSSCWQSPFLHLAAAGPENMHMYVYTTNIYIHKFLLII